MEGRLEESKSIFSRNRAEPAASPVVIRDGSLRQRGGVAAPVEIEESLLQPDQDAPVRGDSMSLFATLVPPPLRKSKKNFSSGKQVALYTNSSRIRYLSTDITTSGAHGNGSICNRILLPCRTHSPDLGMMQISPVAPFHGPMTTSCFTNNRLAR